jgi:dihydroorotate dehydrogenase
MRVGGIDFRPVENASGAQGFFGEGYPFHRYWKLAGLTFQNCGFVAKTTTMEERLSPKEGKGNMPLKKDGITPKEFRPKCIVVKFQKGVVLNSVGLSGPGAERLLQDGRWQKRTEPFWLSFMSVQRTASDRLLETWEFVGLMKRHVPDFAKKVGLEINFSCPNVGLDSRHLLNEIGETLDVAGRLQIPLRVKLNALVPPSAAVEVARHNECDAITMGNTIPWGQLPDRIDWKGLFGTDVSPLVRLGGGGLSGWPLLSIVCDWIREARDFGLAKPIVACGGIDSVEAVRRVFNAGASGVQLGCVGILRPWRKRGIIRCANQMFD